MPKLKSKESARNPEAVVRRRRRKFKIYKGMGRYILRLLNQSSVQNKISKLLSKVLSSFIIDNIKSQLDECISLERKVGKRIVRGSTVNSAIRLLYREELARHMNFLADSSFKTFRDNVRRS